MVFNKLLAFTVIIRVLDTIRTKVNDILTVFKILITTQTLDEELGPKRTSQQRSSLFFLFCVLRGRRSRERKSSCWQQVLLPGNGVRMCLV